MTGPEFAYPEQDDRETGAEYYARVHAMGLPYPWERDKAVPPGPITVTHEWAVSDEHGGPWPMPGERAARQAVAERQGNILHKRPRWVAVGDWEDVPQ